MKHKPLAVYLILVAVLSGGFVCGMKAIGKSGFYLAGFYMLGPAIAAIITRLFFYPRRFKDAHLRFGRVRSYLRFYGITLAIVAGSYVVFTTSGSVSWDFSGETFLAQLEEQMAQTGQDINDLPAGLTPQMMLLLYCIGGLTVFNIPTVIVGFGEEFGWRGFMFPQLYRIRPWVGFVVGGLIWFAWHVPLSFVMPQTVSFAPWEHAVNAIVLAIAALCTFAFFAYVYAKSGSIWVASFVHAVLNNASHSFSYYAPVEHQLLANAGLAVTMAVVVLVLYLRREFAVFERFFADERAVA